MTVPLTVESFGGTAGRVQRLPTRNFPGVLIQGDRLYLLARQARKALDHLEGLGLGQEDEVYALMTEVSDDLSAFVAVYEAALGAERTALPYVRE